MAEALPDHGRIKEEVTCAICLELFDHPLLLPCTHTFCKACLETMLAKSAAQHRYRGRASYNHPSLCCPQCQEKVTLPEGVGQLRKNNLAANIVASLTKSLTDKSPEADENKSSRKEARRGPDRSQQKSIQSQLKKLQNRLEQQQCDIADQQEREQENVEKIAGEAEEKKREVSDHFKKLRAQLQVRERELHQEVDASQVKATAVLQGHLTSLESRMAASLSTLDKVFDLIKKNMSSAGSALQDEVDALEKQTKQVCGSVLEITAEETDTPACLQLSAPPLDSFGKGITLYSITKNKTESSCKNAMNNPFCPDNFVMKPLEDLDFDKELSEVLLGSDDLPLEDIPDFEEL